ncbi:MAG: DUF1254 domain-containing protein [Terriglobales bacterium]
MLTLPVMNTIGMRDGSEAKFGKGDNVLPIWKDRMNAKTWVPTPNCDVSPSMSYLDLKETGPLVVYAPTNVIGMFTDFWQNTLTDVGAIGPDRARGGVDLLLPPGYEGNVPGGYFAVKSSTSNVFLFFRTVMKPGENGPDPTDAEALAEMPRDYPLDVLDKDRKPMQFPNGSNVRFNMMYPTDFSYGEKLKSFEELDPDAERPRLPRHHPALWQRHRVLRPDLETRRRCKGEVINVINRPKDTTMKTRSVQILLSTALICAAAMSGLTTQALAQEANFPKLANLQFKEKPPTKGAATTEPDQLLFQRATQAYLWALPLINTLAMKNGLEKVFGAGYNVLPVWKQRLDAKTLVTTPNSDVIYAMSYVDLGKTGPLVFEAPANLQGTLLDFWQRPIPVDGGKFSCDVGLPGPDAGKGGKFLLLPPGYTGEVPEGYFVCRSGTYNAIIFLRSSCQDPKDPKPAVALVEQSKIYPLNGKETSKPMQFPDASGVPAIMGPVTDGRGFDQVKQLVDGAGANLGESDLLGALAAIGIVKGQPFDPDAHSREILDRAARTAYNIRRVIGFQDVFGHRSIVIYPDRQRLTSLAEGTPANPSGAMDLEWRKRAYLDQDAKIWFFTDDYSTGPGMISRVLGKGAKYLVIFTESEGKPLSGGSDYRLSLPTNIAGAKFWSVTLYEAETASGLANGQTFPSLGSRDKPVPNADGSTYVYLGPRAPKGEQANWLGTLPGQAYFAILRNYGPTGAAIDGSRKPGDKQKVK